jgi:hypothetical protein
MATVSEKQGTGPAAGPLTGADLERALDYVLSHRMAFSQAFLRDRGLAFSGTKEKLRARFEEYLVDRRVPADDLVQLLNEIEGWGNQHLYLYRAPDRLLEPWWEEASARERLADLGLESLFGRQRPLVLPDQATLASIEWAPDRARFVWVEKRQWTERASEQDIEQDDMVWQAYRRKVTRGLVAFDWDLVSGDAMLMIQRLPAGRTYRPVRDRYEAELAQIVGLDHFQRVRVGPAIHPIERSDEVRRRQLTYRTLRGGEAALTSANQWTDAYADPILNRAGQALQDDTAGLRGNFYWLPVAGKLGGEVHTKIYGSDERIGIFGEHREGDVRYVISRIRHHCR